MYQGIRYFVVSEDSLNKALTLARREMSCMASNENADRVEEAFEECRKIEFDALPKLLAFVDAWDDCQTVTANQVEKLCILLAARKALDEVPG